MSRRSAIRLVPAAAHHVGPLAARLRRIDRIECAAMGLSATAALDRGLATSAQCWTALVDDLPQAMFGVVVESAATGDAVPWFLGSDEVAAHGSALVRLGPSIVRAMHRHGRTLRNYVSAENCRAIRLLTHWGFVVLPDPIPVRGVPFRLFIRETE